MKKIVLLLIALTIAPWAKTWEDAETFYSDAWFEGGSLDRTPAYDQPTEETMRRLYFLAEYGGSIDSMGVLKEYYSLEVLNDSNNAGDSVWISKYWMDDSLLEEPVVMDADVDRDDFRLLTFDSLHTEHDLWPLLDERAENASERKSLFLLYRKDSSYYALCLMGRLSGCTFYLSCQFQDDGTASFGKIPDAEGINFSEGCPLTSLPKSSRLPPSVGLQDGVPYRVNGTRSRGGASSVVIRNGQPKAELRK
ncbi:MAG: hypothetical protein WCR04_09660 [Fibrobacteraceae bacterium]